MATRTARRPSGSVESFDVGDEEFDDNPAPSRRKVNQRSEKTPKTPQTAKGTNMNTSNESLLNAAVKLLDGTRGIVVKMLTGEKVSIKTENGARVRLSISELKPLGKGFKQVAAPDVREPNPSTDGSDDEMLGKKVKLLDGSRGIVVKMLKTKVKVEMDSGENRLIPQDLLKPGKRYYTEMESVEEEEESENGCVGKMVKLLDGSTGEIVRTLLKGRVSVKTNTGRVRLDLANLKQLANGNFKEMKAAVEKEEATVVTGEREQLMELIAKLTRRVAKLEKALV